MYKSIIFAGMCILSANVSANKEIIVDMNKNNFEKFKAYESTFVDSNGVRQRIGVHFELDDFEAMNKCKKAGIIVKYAKERAAQLKMSVWNDFECKKLNLK
mgnify:CR=1 FL=1